MAVNIVIKDSEGQLVGANVSNFTLCQMIE